MEKTKKYYKEIIIVILVLFVIIGSGSGFSYIKKQEKILNHKIDSLHQENKILQDSIIIFSNMDVELQEIESDYYDEYVREYNKRIKAERNLRNIRDLIFNRKYLDSLAEHIRYN